MKSKSVVLKEFKQLISTKYSQSTVDSYCYYVGEFLEFSDNAPLRVTNDDFMNYNIHLTKLDISDSTRNVAINAIKCYFKLYLKKKVKNYSSLRPRKRKTLPKVIPHHLLIEKINSIVNQKHRLIMKLGYCGLRIGEVITLKLENIDIEENFIIVFGKGKKERKVPLSQFLVNEIISYYDNFVPDTYLFNGQNSIKYSTSSIRNKVKECIGDYRFHDLRHSFATRLLELGTDIKIIKELLGHEHLKTTEIYTHVNNNILKRVEMPV